MQVGVESTRAVENKRIFVVDTDEIVRAALQFILHDENETHELATIEQAVMKSRQWKPDAIVLGTEIVQSSGASVIGQLQREVPEARICVVVESNSDPLRAIALGAGAHATLSKPLTIEGVRRQVDRVLGRRIPLSVRVEVG